MNKFHLAALGFAAIAVVHGAAHAGAIIQNDQVQLGVGDHGALNVYGGTPAAGSETTVVGMRSVRTNSDSTSPGCDCEGWGVGLRSTGEFGQSNNAIGGVQNLSLVSFAATASTAVSIVDVLGWSGSAILRVTHDYRPVTGTPYLYESRVSFTNLTGRDLVDGDLVYRRVMDWDIPSPGSESVTIAGVPTALGLANGSNLYRVDNNGFNPGNPFEFTSMGLMDQNFTNVQNDHGAMFDFEFQALGIDQTRSFSTFYGVAPNKVEADLARHLVDGDASTLDISLYSYGSCTAGLPGCDPITGAPDTFIFGFGSGDGAVLKPVEVLTGVAAVPEPASLALVGLALTGVGITRRRRAARA